MGCGIRSFQYATEKTRKLMYNLFSCLDSPLKIHVALPSVAQLVECRSVRGKDTCSIQARLGHMPALQVGSLECIREATN